MSWVDYGAIVLGINVAFLLGVWFARRPRQPRS